MCQDYAQMPSVFNNFNHLKSPSYTSQYSFTLLNAVLRPSSGGFNRVNNLRTAIEPAPTNIVVFFLLTHKGNFFIVLPIKNTVLSNIYNHHRQDAFWSSSAFEDGNMTIPFEKSGIQCEFLTKSFAEEAAVVVTDTFLNYEPLISSLGVNRQDYLSCAKAYCADAAEQGLSLVARDRNSAEIAGFIISEDLVTEWNQDGDAKLITLIAPALSLVHALERKFLFEKNFEKGECLHIFQIGVLPGFQGRSIATTLIQKTLEVAREKGYGYAVADCTGPVSQRCHQKCDFSQQDSINFRSFDFEGRHVFSKLEGECALMVKKLK